MISHAQAQVVPSPCIDTRHRKREFVESQEGGRSRHHEEDSGNSGHGKGSTGKQQSEEEN